MAATLLALLLAADAGVAVDWQAPFSGATMAFAADERFVYDGDATPDPKTGEARLELRQLSTATGAPGKRLPLGERCDALAGAAADGRGVVLLCAEAYTEEGPAHPRRAAAQPRVWALAPDGKTRWTFPVAVTWGALGCDARGCLLGLMQGLVALDGASGRALWRTPGLDDAVVGGEGAVAWSAPALTDAAIFAATADDFGREQLRALSRKDGRALWAKGVPGSADATRVRVAGALVLLDTTEPRSKGAALTCFEQATGKQAWSLPFPAAIEYAADAQSVFVGTSGGVTAVEPASGATRWVSTLPEGRRWELASVTFAGAALAWSTDAKQHRRALSALDARSGAVRWTWAVPPGDDSSPEAQVLAAAGPRLLVVAQDTLFALRPVAR